MVKTLLSTEFASLPSPIADYYRGCARDPARTPFFKSVSKPQKFVQRVANMLSEANLDGDGLIGLQEFDGCMKHLCVPRTCTRTVLRP